MALVKVDLEWYIRRNDSKYTPKKIPITERIGIKYDRSKNNKMKKLKSIRITGLSIIDYRN